MLELEHKQGDEKFILNKNIYSYEWLYENLLNIRMIKKIFPIYLIGNDDPEDVKKLKEKLDNIKIDLEDLSSLLYKMVKKAKNK